MIYEKHSSMLNKKKILNVYILSLLSLKLRKFDINNSGKISAEELQIVLSKMYRNISRSEIEDMIRKVDANNDGHISIDEFIDFLNL